jgi:hypothetical protein
MAKSYGFKDREVALRLKRMVTEGRSASIGSPRYEAEPEGIITKNVSGQIIPAWGVSYIKSDAATVSDVGTDVEVRRYDQIPSAESFEKQFALINGPLDIAANAYGMSQANQQTCEIRYNGAGTAGEIYGPDTSDPFVVKAGANITAGVTWQFIAPLQSTPQTGLFVRTTTESATAFFLTPSGGMAAAASQLQPTFTLCERLYFIGTTIEASTPPEFVEVGNHIETAVRADVVIQAKRIDGFWFIDVEPCE